MRVVESAAPPAAVLTISRMFRCGQSESCVRAAEVARSTAATTVAKRPGILVAIMGGSFSARDSERSKRSSGKALATPRDRSISAGCDRAGARSESGSGATVDGFTQIAVSPRSLKDRDRDGAEQVVHRQLVAGVQSKRCIAQDIAQGSKVAQSKRCLPGRGFGPGTTIVGRACKETASRHNDYAFTVVAHMGDDFILVRTCNLDRAIAAPKEHVGTARAKTKQRPGEREFELAARPVPHQGGPIRLVTGCAERVESDIVIDRPTVVGIDEGEIP